MRVAMGAVGDSDSIGLVFYFLLTAANQRT